MDTSLRHSHSVGIVDDLPHHCGGTEPLRALAGKEANAAVLHDGAGRTKRCTTCGEDKPWGDFFLRFGQPNGPCKPCKRIKDNARTKLKREQHNPSRPLMVPELRAWITRRCA